MSESVWRRCIAALFWAKRDRRWLKLCYLVVLIGSFAWAAISFYSEAVSWKNSESGKAGYSGVYILLSEAWHKCFGKGAFGPPSPDCHLGESVTMHLERDKNSAAVVAKVSVSVHRWRHSDYAEKKWFLIIRRPVIPDPLSEGRYENRTYIDQLIELQEPPPFVPGLIRWSETMDGRGEVIPMSASAWWSRPFGSHETTWVLCVASKKKNSSDGSLEFLPVDTLDVAYPVGVTMEVGGAGLEQEKHLLELSGATWLNDGLGLMRVSYKPSGGVKAFWFFLLILIALPVLLCWLNPSAEKSALELLGSLATFGAVRAIVVGEKLVPSLVDVYLGLLLVALATMYLFVGYGGKLSKKARD